MRSHCSVVAVALACYAGSTAAAIDRASVVRRHSPRASLLPSDVFSLGNGAFSFNVDASGLQSFNESYANMYDVQTLADWAWHTLPFSLDNPAGALLAFQFTNYTTRTSGGGSREVPYPTDGSVSKGIANWLHSNPHRLNLAQLSLRLDDGTGEPTLALSPSDLNGLSAALDTWEGAFESNFTLRGAITSVHTVAHPDVDAVSTRVTCPDGCPLALRIAFPYARGGNPSASSWVAADDALHSSSLVWNTTIGANSSAGSFSVARALDADSYTVACTWTAAGSASWMLSHAGAHVFELRRLAGSGTGGAIGIELTCAFAPRAGDSSIVPFPVGADMPWLRAKAALTAPFVDPSVRTPLPSHDEVAASAALSWASFWLNGSFVELDGGAGALIPAAVELQRRVVLSLYLTRVHSTGAEPPAETGLLCNSW